MSGILAKFRKNKRILPPLQSSCSIEKFTLGEDPHLAFHKCSQLISNLESVSCRGTGQQWTAVGAGALGAADLGMT